MNSRFSNKLSRPLIILVVLIAVAAGGFYLLSDKSSNISSPKKVESQRIKIDANFELPIGSEKDVLRPIKVSFQTGQLTNRIFISGKPKTAKVGTKFLMLNVLIENSNNARVNFKTRDVVRLIDTNDKKFAPSLYNKTVAVEPDSSKKDTVGFVVPKDFKEFKIQYGKLSGYKQTLELKFN